MIAHSSKVGIKHNQHKLAPVRIVKGMEVEWSKWADKVSVLTASVMLLHAFLSMFVNSRKTVFTDTADSTVLLNISTENENYQFLSYDIESA
jgi:hypothetical protein